MKEVIIRMYNQGLTIGQIAEHIGKGYKYVRNRLIKNNIKLTFGRRPDILFTKDELYDLYINQQKTLRQIGNIFNVSRELVRRRLVEFGIKARQGSDAVRTQWIDNDNRRISQSEFAKNNLPKHGVDHPCWNGGIEKNNGYLFEYSPEHPNTHHNKIRQHRLIMEKHIGRLLTKDEVVHHINGIRDDNRIENLQLMTASEHNKLHKKE